MKEIASTFQTFYQLLKYIITRLRNNSVWQKSAQAVIFSVRFLLIKSDISQFNETDINEVLNTFSNQDKRYEDDSVTLFEYSENESHYAIKSDKEKVNTLQNIYANLIVSRYRCPHQRNISKRSVIHSQHIRGRMEKGNRQ